MEEQGRKRKRLESKGKESAADQLGTIRYILPQEDLRQIKQEPEERRPQQHWDAQWQDFLKTMQPPRSRWETPQAPSPPLSGDGVLPASFRGAADASRWPSGRAGGTDQTLPDLSGEAHEEGGEQISSVKVKKEILDEEEEDANMRSEMERQSFRRFCYQEAKGPREAWLRLQELCSRWLKPERRTKEEMVELLVLEQFLTILPAEMQSWVKGCRLETCAQAAALTEDFLLQLQDTEGLPGKEAATCSGFWAPQEAEPANLAETEPATLARMEGGRWMVDGQFRDKDSQTVEEDESQNSVEPPVNSLGRTKKQLKCMECGMCFDHSGSLRIHQQAHKGEKLFECMECGKNFTVLLSIAQKVQLAERAADTLLTRAGYRQHRTPILEQLHLPNCLFLDTMC